MEPGTQSIKEMLNLDLLFTDDETNAIVKYMIMLSKAEAAKVVLDTFMQADFLSEGLMLEGEILCQNMKKEFNEIEEKISIFQKQLAQIAAIELYDFYGELKKR